MRFAAPLAVHCANQAACLRLEALVGQRHKHILLAVAALQLGAQVALLLQVVQSTGRGSRTLGGRGRRSMRSCLPSGAQVAPLLHAAHDSANK